MVYAFLELARTDLRLIVDRIGREYRRKQAEAEYELIGHALNLAEMANQQMYSDSRKERLLPTLRAVKKIAWIAALQVKGDLV